MIRKIPRLFLNIFTIDDKHYVLNRDNLTERIEMQLSKKQQTFSAISFVFLNAILNFKHLPKKKMTLIVDVFLEISAKKDIVR